MNRGNRSDEIPQNVHLVTGDINNHPDEVVAKLAGETFDVVCEFIGFLSEQVERDIKMFSGRTKQYVFISSASAYNKPVHQHVISEGTSLANPYWEYSRNKIACEDYPLVYMVLRAVGQKKSHNGDCPYCEIFSI